MLLQELIHAFQRLPGVGPKSAQRMAFYLLERDRAGGQRLSEILHRAMRDILHCVRCRNFSETALCALCANPKREVERLLIVETPADVLAVEQTQGYRGSYFVLMGHLSPLDGIGPREIGIELLKDRLQEAGLLEVIIATNATAEGEATAHYIAPLVKAQGLRVTRLARGMPLGGELENVSHNTLMEAIQNRKEY